jgi:hypothetical protein
MKKFIVLFIIVFLTSNSFSQEKELELFKKDLNFYIDFRLGKIATLPLNESNQIKYRKKVDEAFANFVLHKNSSQYDKLIIAKDDEKKKFLRLDDRISIYLTTFILNNKTYVVYSYTSGDKINFFIKENESNIIVYEGNSKSCFIDDMYLIDDSHILLIEKNGDFNSSRSAMVLSIKKNPWSIIKAFEGNAFGQVPGEYFSKKYVKTRDTFQLDCEMGFTLSAPEDINRISFDTKTKTLSYKQYFENKKFKLITAKWENEKFIIDDYNVNENLSESSTAVPR